MDVSLSAASRTALLALTGIQSDMGKLQLRLATGKRVNSPVDDPNAYFLSKSLSARAATLGALSSKISTGKSTIDAANNGLATIQNLLSAARSIANQALQQTQTLAAVTATNSSALTTNSQIASTAGSATEFKAGDTLTVSDGTTTATYTAADGDTVQDVLDAVNNTSGLKVTASLNSSGQIKFTATSNVNITIGGAETGAGTLSSVLGLTAGTTNYSTNTIRQNLAAQFDSLRTQIDQAAQDAGLNGTNLLTDGSLSVDFNEDGTSSLTITGVSAKSADLGLAASSNTWQLDTNINASLDQIETAIDSLQSYTATFGSMAAIMQARSDFNNSMITTLNSGADTLVASDVNEDSAMLLALQTRQQIATAALSFTQGANTAALKLFGM